MQNGASDKILISHKRGWGEATLMIIKCSKGTFSLTMLLTEEYVSGFTSDRGAGVKLEISPIGIPTINFPSRIRSDKPDFHERFVTVDL